MTPISINTDMTPIYQLDMSWIFINSDMTPNSINLICLGYLFM